MHAHGVDIGAIEQGLVGRRVVALDPLDQFVLTQKLLPGLGRRRGLNGRGLRADGWRGRERRNRRIDFSERG